eukprot:353082-Chlamydomonas_euryale.AAC.20
MAVGTVFWISMTRMKMASGAAYAPTAYPPITMPIPSSGSTTKRHTPVESCVRSGSAPPPGPCASVAPNPIMIVGMQHAPRITTALCTSASGASSPMSRSRSAGTQPTSSANSDVNTLGLVARSRRSCRAERSARCAHPGAAASCAGSTWIAAAPGSGADADAAAAAVLPHDTCRSPMSGVCTLVEAGARAAGGISQLSAAWSRAST